MTYHYVSSFENFRETVVRQVEIMDHSNLKEKKVVGCKTLTKIYRIYEENQWSSVA